MAVSSFGDVPLQSVAFAGGSSDFPAAWIFLVEKTGCIFPGKQHETLRGETPSHSGDRD